MKSLKVKHRVYLKGLGLDPKDFLLKNENYESYTFIERSSKREFCCRY